MRTYLLVFSNPVEGKEDEYNDWYTNIHVKEVVEVEGIISAQRFTLAKGQDIENQSHKYLAIYELENENVEGTMQNLVTSAAKMQMEPVIDMGDVKIAAFQSITDVIKQP